MAIKRRKNPASVAEAHPLNALDFLKVEIWWEDASRATGRGHVQIDSEAGWAEP